MRELAVCARTLEKRFGSHRALCGIDLNIPYGSVYGFIGGNGAGKTTTLRILLGLAKASGGQAFVLGKPRGRLPGAPLPGVAYVPDVPNLAGELTARETVQFAGQLAGLSAQGAARQTTKLLTLVGLGETRAKVRGFSRGMRQRLAIAAALIGQPQLLIFDEPTSALDPFARAEVLNIIRALGRHATVVFSSHILADVQAVATHVGMIDRGHMIAEGPIDKVLAMGAGAGARTRISVDVAPRAAQRAERAITTALAGADIDAEVKATPSTLQAAYAHLAGRRRDG